MVHYQRGASITLKPLVFLINNAALISYHRRCTRLIFHRCRCLPVFLRWNSPADEKLMTPIVSAFASLSMRCVTLLHGPVGRTDRPVNQKQRLIWPLGAEHKARFMTAALLTSGFSIRLIISYWPLWHELYVHHTNIDGKARVCICVHVSLKTMMHHSF